MTDLAPDVVELAPWVPSPATGSVREVAFDPRSWLPEELDTLRTMFAADEPIAAIAKAIGRGRGAIQDRMRLTGLRRASAAPWTAHDDRELVRRYGGEAAAGIAQDLGRAVTSVYARARMLGIAEASAPPWSGWEDAQLRAGFEQSIPVGQLAALIGRTMSATWTRAAKLGLAPAGSPPRWSQPECARALELAEQGLRYAFIRQRMADEGFPERSKVSFHQMIRKLGYGRGWGRPWTPEEDVLLRRAYANGESLTRLAARLGRRATKDRAGRLGLQGTHVNHSGFRQGPDWTEPDMARLREAYGKVPSKQLAAELGRGYRAMLVKAHALGLVHGYCRPYSEDEIAFVRAAWALPVSQAEVAAALGRKAPALAKWTSNHGIFFSDPARPAKPSKKPGRPRLTTRAEILALADKSPPRERSPTCA